MKIYSKPLSFQYFNSKKSRQQASVQKIQPSSIDYNKQQSQFFSNKRRQYSAGKVKRNEPFLYDSKDDQIIEGWSKVSLSEQKASNFINFMQMDKTAHDNSQNVKPSNLFKQLNSNLLNYEKSYLIREKKKSSMVAFKKQRQQILNCQSLLQKQNKNQERVSKKFVQTKKKRNSNKCFQYPHTSRQNRITSGRGSTTFIELGGRDNKQNAAERTPFIDSLKGNNKVIGRIISSNKSMMLRKLSFQELKQPEESNICAQKQKDQYLKPKPQLFAVVNDSQVFRERKNYSSSKIKTSHVRTLLKFQNFQFNNIKEKLQKSERITPYKQVAKTSKKEQAYLQFKNKQLLTKQKNQGKSNTQIASSSSLNNQKPQIVFQKKQIIQKKSAIKAFYDDVLAHYQTISPTKSLQLSPRTTTVQKPSTSNGLLKNSRKAKKQNTDIYKQLMKNSKKSCKLTKRSISVSDSNQFNDKNMLI